MLVCNEVYLSRRLLHHYGLCLIELLGVVTVRESHLVHLCGLEVEILKFITLRCKIQLIIIGLVGAVGVRCNALVLHKIRHKLLYFRVLVFMPLSTHANIGSSMTLIACGKNFRTKVFLNLIMN